MNEVQFISALIYLIAAVLAVPIAKRFGLGSVLGYLIAGVLVGTLTRVIGFDAGTESLAALAELGVVMMLFLIGLELNPKSLWDMRNRLIGLGAFQVVATAAGIAFFGRYIMDAEWNHAIAAGLVLSLSSTAIVLQTLNEKGLFKSEGGQASFSVLLFQDIAVIPILAFLPLLAAPELVAAAGDVLIAADHNVDDHGGAHLDFNLVKDFPGWQVGVINIVAVCAVVVGGQYFSRPVFRYIAAARLREIFTAAAVLLVMLVTFLMSLVGLSPALGTFLAGVVLANSEFRHELESNIEPFKGLLLGLFFITVGAGIDFEVVYANAFILTFSTIGLILLKMIILYAIATLFGIKLSSDKWLFTLGLAQAGEFGFVLIAFASQNSVLPQELVDNLLIVVALSMLLTPAIFVFYEKVLQPHLKKTSEDNFDTDINKGTVIIAGHGRFGQVIDRMLLASGYKTVVLEYRTDVINHLRVFGTKTFYGDAGRPDLLAAAGIKEAKMMVVTIDDAEKAVEIVKHARKENPKIHIIARAWDRRYVYSLYAAGADDIVREVFDSSVRTGRYALEAMGLSRKEAQRRADLFVKHDMDAVRRLAQVWDPDIPIFENERYIAVAKQLREEVADVMRGDQIRANPDMIGRQKGIRVRRHKSPATRALSVAAKKNPRIKSGK